MEETIRWGHFSDLHYRFDNTERFNTSLLRSALLDSLDKIGKLHYIFITGDIFHKGERDEQTVTFIKQIANKTGCDYGNIIICPGNHDGKRVKARKIAIDSVIEDSKSGEFDINDWMPVMVDTPFLEFRQAVKDITGTQPPENIHYARNLGQVNLYVLNTAIFSGQTYPKQAAEEEKRERNKENTNLYICDKHLRNVKCLAESENFTEEHLTIVVGHHGIECFAENEQKLLRGFLGELKADLYLCGHVHRNTNTVLQNTKGIQQVSCGGLFADPKNEPSFIVGELHPDCRVMLNSYSYFDNNNSWAPSMNAPWPYEQGIHECVPPRFARQNRQTAKPAPASGSQYEFSLMKMMKRTIMEAPKGFFGYANEQKALKDALNGSGYYYVHGEQLFGKTTLIAKTIHDVCLEGRPDAMLDTLPWLSHCFAVFGKQASSITTAMRMLTEQLNLVLSEPIDEAFNISDKNSFGRLISKACAQLDRVVIVFDALDEMGMDDLKLFPKTLPENCAMILSSNVKLNGIQERMEDIKQIHLNGFTKDEIFSCMGLKKNAKGTNVFVEFVLNMTKGNPLFIGHIADAIRENNNEIPEDYQKAFKRLDSPFMKFREEWASDNTRNEILKLLTIFEDVGYISIHDIQDYLWHREIQLDSEEIQVLLRPVQPQLECDEDESQYKLKYSSFASYLLDKWSDKDFELRFGPIADWFAESRGNGECLTPFFLSWYMYNGFASEKTWPVFERILGDGKTDELKTIMVFIFAQVAIDKENLEDAHACIEACKDALQEDDDVIMLYFSYLYGIIDNEASKAEALRYLSGLADRRVPKAVITYSQILAKGDMYCERNPAKAIEYLKTIDETEEGLELLYDIYSEIDNFSGMDYCTNRLLEYDNPKHKIQRAQFLAFGGRLKESLSLLDELIAQNNVEAMEKKANLIANNLFPDCDMSEAVALWERIGNRSAKALFHKGEWLYENGDISEGIKWLKKAQNKGIGNAAIYLACIAIKERNFFTDQQVAVLNLNASIANEAAFVLYEGTRLGLIKKRLDYSQDELYQLGTSGNLDGLGLIYFGVGANEHSFTCFESMYQKDPSGGSAIHMAYLLRRGYVIANQYSVKELLEPHVKASNSLAIINYALECLKEDRGSCLRVLRKLDTEKGDFGGAVGWWRDLAQKNDEEGILVLDLLAEAGKIDAQ